MPVRPSSNGGPGRYCPRMTWLWYLLIVIGAAMIVMAFWPGKGKKKDAPADENEEGLG
ncbi:hypothetical protein Adu01nite_42890 [Paractinoplanes durhamensis]|uniref:Uncharacterized protein n=1 Tax=Paractinoplanes durhamensis TaxID=113563 RepID=A0ABQ3Z061_9ACTN|nr:hypothetical protein Adu01nite_42890 [Actinoplanes durhamensis]